MKLFLPLVIFVATQNLAFAEPGSLAVTNLAPGTHVSLDGDWQFLPAEGKLAPADSAPKSIDAAAKKIASEPLPAWPALKVPQLLNHTVWWNQNVSLEYEDQEAARVKAFPFDAKKTKAGWYRYELVLPAWGTGAPPDLVVNFEGVAMISRVYCNGAYVGGHLGMFGAFDCRLTPHLKWGAKNQLLVYVERGASVADGEKVVQVAVTVAVTKDMLTSLNAGMFGGFGNGPRAKFMGIWQPVTLKVAAPAGRIADVFFIPSLQGHEIQFTIENPQFKAISGSVSYTIRDAETKTTLVAETLPAAIIAPGKSVVVTAKRADLSPNLWTPDEPRLYKLEASWKDAAGGVSDTAALDVGYRTVAVKGEQVYLNGKPYWSRGANTAPYGYKPNDEPTARGFLQAMHDGNTVITRTHGNPWNELWLSLADRIGIGVSVEGVRPWALMSKSPPPPRPILQQWKDEQLESVRQYRNHPSILFYCVSNEGIQGDDDNKKKQRIFHDIIEEMRKLDPTRPIFQTSGDSDPAHNADIEDIHSYWGWYESSSYVNSYATSMRGLTLGDHRPFLNQECAVPYQMIDDGSVLPNYIRLFSAHPWVGDIGVHGGDSKYFSRHVGDEAKLKAEKLRYQRVIVPTAGVMLFNNSTWIQHALSRPPSEWKPLPVYEGVRVGFQPVLVALESTQSFFYAGAALKSNVYVVNDDVKFRNLAGLTLKSEILDADGQVVAGKSQPVGAVAYYAVGKNPFEITIPALPGDESAPKFGTLRLQLLDAQGNILSTNPYPIRVAAPAWAAANVQGRKIAVDGCDEAITQFLKSGGAEIHPLAGASGMDAVLLGPKATEVGEASAAGALRAHGRLLVLGQGAAALRFAPDAARKNAVDGARTDQPIGEFVEMLGWQEKAPVFDGLDAMDWKWWARGNAEPAYAASASHHLDPKSILPLGRFLDSHFYWHGDMQKNYDSQIGYPVFAVKRPWGELVVCDLTIPSALPYDPRAGRTLSNLLTRALPQP